MQIAATVLLFILGIGLGYIICYWMNSKKQDGTIVAEHDVESGKILYSLVLEDYAEKLSTKDTLIFKVTKPSK